MGDRLDREAGPVERIGTGPGKWQVTCADGEVLIVDRHDETLRTLGRDGGVHHLVSVDSCGVGVPGAFTIRDSDEAEVPWFTDRVVSVVRLGDG